jgi:hypothetical protein
MSEHISPKIQALAARGTPITLAEWLELRLNSYEQELLYPKLDNEAFLYALDNVLLNCTLKSTRRPCVVYDDALQVIFVPELRQRFTALLKTMHQNARP